MRFYIKNSLLKQENKGVIQWDYLTNSMEQSPSWEDDSTLS
jgi:hypothetical protein